MSMAKTVTVGRSMEDIRKAYVEAQMAARAAEQTRKESMVIQSQRKFTVDRLNKGKDTQQTRATQLRVQLDDEIADFSAWKQEHMETCEACFFNEGLCQTMNKKALQHLLEVQRCVRYGQDALRREAQCAEKLCCMDCKVRHKDPNLCRQVGLPPLGGSIDRLTEYHPCTARASATAEQAEKIAVLGRKFTEEVEDLRGLSDGLREYLDRCIVAVAGY